jgi:uncharacterized protein (DUF302 family)
MRPVLLGLALLVVLWPGPGSGQPAVEQTDHFFVVRRQAPFEDVMSVLQEAIKRRNYAITGVNHLDDTLARRAADVAGPELPYARYKVVGFCNLTLADEAVRLSPHVGAFMPCRAVVFQVRGSPETVVVAFRPTALGLALGDGGLGPVMERAERDVWLILTEVAAD